jgi:hypothetical protein
MATVDLALLHTPPTLADLKAVLPKDWWSRLVKGFRDAFGLQGWLFYRQNREMPLHRFEKKIVRWTVGFTFRVKHAKLAFTMLFGPEKDYFTDVSPEVEMNEE